MDKRTLTRSRLKELLQYNPDTGLFTRLTNIKGPTRAGDIAGSKTALGYISISIDNTRYLAHRLSFLYMVGEYPIQTDHINHIRTDNRWINLRPATNLINGRNQSMGNNNTSKCTGVYWDKSRDKWLSMIMVNGKNIHLCRNPDYFEACCARKSAERKYGFHENHGI